MSTRAIKHVNTFGEFKETKKQLEESKCNYTIIEDEFNECWTFFLHDHYDFIVHAVTFNGFTEI